MGNKQGFSCGWKILWAILMLVLTIVALTSCGGKKTPEPQEQTVTATSPLVAHWAFDEKGGTTSVDATANGNRATLNGTKWTEGKFGAALEFDGVQAYVEVPDSDSLDLSESFTITAWVKLAEVGTGRQLLLEKKDVDQGDNSTNYALYVQWTHDALALVVGDGERRVGYLSDRGLETPNEWHHIAVTFGEGKIRFYIDGEPAGVDTTTVKPCVNKGPLSIGRYVASDASPRFQLKGSLDDLRIYSTALTHEEIQQLIRETGPSGTSSP